MYTSYSIVSKVSKVSIACIVITSDSFSPSAQINWSRPPDALFKKAQSLHRSPYIALQKEDQYGSIGIGIGNVIGSIGFKSRPASN